MSEPNFRQANGDDWPAIWSIFSAVVSTGDTYTFPTDIGEASARAAWLADEASDRRTFVAELDGNIVGTALLKPNADGHGDHVANAGWMVSPHTSGRGIGRRFAEFVIDDARRAGYAAMQFNAVVETNERAVALWRSLGFEIIGTVPEAFRHPTAGHVGLHIMYRRL